MSTSPPLVVADRYRLVAPLGQGGMGRVWRATDVVLHRDVAIKELVPPPGLTTEERREMRERSLREARAIARLNNINVVRVFDVLRTDSDPWIVMEYVPSRSLQDILAEDGPYPATRAAEIGLGVLGALRAAHREGVVHRDVKPGNVLIGMDGRVVLTDFGLATVPGDPNVTRTGLVLGSPAYIAPERARDGSAGPGADLWSLGATLYAAVEGASPFARPSAIATLAALATENPPPARNAGPLKAVLNGLLRKDPAHRINADEAERLLLRASGRRTKMSFPMSPTMRRPGLGRERPSTPLAPPVIPGAATVSASAPVVPGPRPPISTGRPPAAPPAPAPGAGTRPPVTPAGPGTRPPVYVPGKASVGQPAAPLPPQGQSPLGQAAVGKAALGQAALGRSKADTPTRVDTPKVTDPPLDATRVDGPALDATQVDGPALDATQVDGPALDATRVDGSVVDSPARAAPGRARAATAPHHTPSLDTPTPPTTAAPPSPTAASAAVALPTETTVSPSPDAGSNPTPDEPSSSGATSSKTATSSGTVPSDAAPSDAAPSDAAPSDAAPSDAAPSDAASSGAASSGVASSAAAFSEAASGPDNVGTTSSDEEAPAATAGTSADGKATESKLMGDTSADLQASADRQGDASAGSPAGSASSSAVSTTADDEAESDDDGGTPESVTSGAEGFRPVRNKIKGKANRAKPAKPIGKAGRPSQAGSAPAGAAKDGSATAPKPTADAADSNLSVDAAGSKLSADAAGSKSTTGGSAAPQSAGSAAESQSAVTSAASVASTIGATKVGSQTSGSPKPASSKPESDSPDAKKAGTEKSGSGKSGSGKSGSDSSGGGSGKSGKVGALAEGVTVGSRRPPWQPMPVRAPSSGRAGLTIFGTTLDRRQTYILLAIVAALVLVGALVAAAVFGDDDADKTANKAGPAVGAPATAGARSPQPAGQAPTPAGQAPTSAGQAPTSAEAPKPSAAPSSPSVEDGSTLPAGWRWYRDGNFRVPVPEGWRSTSRGSEIYFQEEAQSRRLLIVDQTRHPKSDPVADWTSQEGDRRGDYRDYHRIGIRPVSYWDKAADWEFTYTSDRGNQLRVVKRGFITANDQAYGITWIVPAGEWDADLGDLKTIYDGFQPARS